ncbi:hypothetical protein SAMN05216297_11711 [Flavobacterium phragmitis]|uniref:Uncharacterized protein n=1 Tax=Flavobacterium phragmitis TaxID=739143 RepID=A0A1I1WRT0_9FLAO|nr:hypothetical protein SAMN05216297_11711 [Flavobacterium phragmitis]
MQFTIILKNKNRSKNDSKLSYLLSLNKKKAPIEDNWRHLVFVTLNEQFTNHFMNDLKKLAYFQMNL